MLYCSALPTASMDNTLPLSIPSVLPCIFRSYAQQKAGLSGGRGSILASKPPFGDLSWQSRRRESGCSEEGTWFWPRYKSVVILPAAPLRVPPRFQPARLTGNRLLRLIRAALDTIPWQAGSLCA